MDSGNWVLYHWQGAFPLHCPNATKYPSTASVPINILLSIIKELSHTKLNQKTGWESRLSRHVSSQDSIFIVLLLPLDVLVLCLETVHNTWRLTRCMSMSLPVGWFAVILSLNSLYSFWSHLSLGVCRWPETVERICDVVLVSAKMKFTYCFVHNVCSWIVLLCFYSFIVCKIKTVSCLERLFSESWSCVHWTVTFSSGHLLSWSHDPCQKMSLNYWKLAPLSLNSCKYNCR